MSKGSKRRPCFVDTETFESNWDIIFNSNQEEDSFDVQENSDEEE